jgi:ribosomal protein L15E
LFIASLVVKKRRRMIGTWRVGRRKAGVRVTAYYEWNVRLRRPDICDHWCETILADPIRTEVQPDGRIKHWGYVADVGRYLRVVTLGDRKTVHNAFFDRRFRP